MLKINRSTVFSITFQYFIAKPVAENHIGKEVIKKYKNKKKSVSVCQLLESYRLIKPQNIWISIKEQSTFSFLVEFLEWANYFNTGVSESWFCNLTSLELWADLLQDAHLSFQGKSWLGKSISCWFITFCTKSMVLEFFLSASMKMKNKLDWGVASSQNFITSLTTYVFS